MLLWAVKKSFSSLLLTLKVNALMQEMQTVSNSNWRDFFDSFVQSVFRIQYIHFIRISLMRQFLIQTGGTEI